MIERWWVNLAELGLFCGVMTLTLICLHNLECFAGRYLSKRLGWYSVLFTGWLGVPLHELSHLVAARLFGHRIVAYRLFEPDPVSGTLGYVRHAYSKRNLWQLSGSFFIGIAPPFAGFTALVGIALLMVPAPLHHELWAAPFGHWPRRIIEAAEPDLWLVLFSYLALCVASHLAPSVADLKNSAPGALVFATLAVAGAALCGFLGVSFIPIRQLYPFVVMLVAGVAALQLSYVGVVALLWRFGVLR